MRAWALVLLLAGALPPSAHAQADSRPRARDLGMVVGVFATGSHNAITDVEGVRVGHETVVEGEDVRTGVTAVVPHGGNLYRDRVPAALFVGNGYGKLLGVTQLRELGELETPILLTCTLCVWRAADAMVELLLGADDMSGVRSINPVVGETNDGRLNDIRSRPIRPEHVERALATAGGGPVAEGAVGAGTGTRAFGWKGGIGTSSRVLPDALGGYTVGVLVQSNFGGILTMGGAPVGREVGRYSFQELVEPGGGAGADGGSGATGPGSAHAAGAEPPHAAAGRVPAPATGDPESPGAADPLSWDEGDGSIMMVVATDAPLSSRNLERLAARAVMGLARTGSFAGNGSGDYVIAFSTAEGVRRLRDQPVRQVQDLANARMSGLFEAAVEATEEAIYNSLLRAVTVTGNGITVEALPLEATVEVLRRHGVVPRP